jgi:hypothetical protein
MTDVVINTSADDVSATIHHELRHLCGAWKYVALVPKWRRDGGVSACGHNINDAQPFMDGIPLGVHTIHRRENVGNLQGNAA